MRISFFVPRCTTDNSHGRYVVELAKRFVPEHEVSIHSAAFSPGLRSLVKCQFLPVPNRPALARLGALWATSFMSIHRASQDIIHIQGSDAPIGNVVTAHCCNAAMRDSVHGLASASRQLNYAIGIRAERYCFTKPSTRVVIAVSNKVKAEIEGSYGVSPEKIVVIPQGVDAEALRPPSRDRSRQVRDSLGLAPDDFIVTFVGGDYRLKGLLTLLEAAKAVDRAIRVIAVGVKPDAFLRAALTRAGIENRVTFVQRTSDPTPYFAASDCFVLPTHYDTFSLATLEAMAVGLPVIVSSAAGVTEHLTDGLDSIVLKDPNDAQALTRNLNRLTCDEALRRTLGEQARKTAERFSWDRVAERTLAVYRNIA